MAAVMALSGWTLERFGARTMWSTSIRLCLLGSVLCGTAGDARSLIAFGIPSALGPVVGGAIVDDWNWRWIFFINVPVCIAAIVLAWRTMPTRRSRTAGKLDVLGLPVLSPACAGVVFGLNEASKHISFADRHVVVPLAIGVLLLAAFAVHALRTDNPILDLRLLKVRGFLSSSAAKSSTPRMRGVS